MRTIIDILRPKGCTSLGPALSVAMGIVSGSVGSEIVLCTDGAPNEGIGSLSSYEDESDNHFYIKVGIDRAYSFEFKKRKACVDFKKFPLYQTLNPFSSYI